MELVSQTGRNGTLFRIARNYDQLRRSVLFDDPEKVALAVVDTLSPTRLDGRSMLEQVAANGKTERIQLAAISKLTVQSKRVLESIIETPRGTFAVRRAAAKRLKSLQ